MIQLKIKDFINGDELSADELHNVLAVATELKRQRSQGRGCDLLKGKTLALLFDKPSLRTRMSFTVAMNELGGYVIESVGTTRKQEEPQDVARVLSGYCHGIMIRTFDEAPIKTMAQYASIPVINGLSDRFHPCQTLADLQTIKETFGQLKGVKVAYIGDGNNTLQSFFPIVKKTGIELHYSCPSGYMPELSVVEKYQGEGTIKCYDNPLQAVKGADVIYTDVWASMGFEEEAEERKAAFEGFQVNKEMLRAAGGRPKLMHCLPMIRGQEIDKDLPDSADSLIFQQSENRLHAQKALLIGLMGKKG